MRRSFQFVTAIVILIITHCTLYAEPSLKVEWRFIKPVTLRMESRSKSVNFEIPRQLASTLSIGNLSTLTASKEQHYPTVYSPPESNFKSMGWTNLLPQRSGMVAPMTPSQFESEWVGVKILLHPTKEGDLVQLTGTIIFQEAVFDNGVFGEGSGPLYMEEKKNKKVKRNVIFPNTGDMMRLSSFQSDFQLNAIPGKTYKVSFRGPNGITEAMVKCSWL